MSPEKEVELFNKYPKILNKECIRHIEVDDGWYSLIDNACSLIQRHLDLMFEQELTGKIPVGSTRQAEAMQIKEKFGTLRFYCVGGDDFTNAIIGRAEEASAHTCEITGLPGSLHTKNSMWLKTINPEYAKEHGYEQAYIKF